MKQFKSRKLILLIAVFVLIIANVAYANGGVEKYQIFIDGKPVQFTKDLGYPTVVNGRTLVPIRIISENMGYKVEWENSQRKVTISDSKTKIEFKIGENTALVNGKKVPMDTREDKDGKIVPVDTKAQLVGSRTYVPIRFISENMGATVDWKIEGKTLYVYIVRPGTTPTTPNVGKIPGTADYSENGHEENIKKVSEFFGIALDKRMSDEGMATFNNIGGGTDTSFLYVVDRPGEKYEAKVVIQNWFVNSDIGTPMEKEMKKINPTVKEVLRFYLPDGYEKLYQIIDDGYNWRWDDASKYLNKDISKMIGSNRAVKLIDGNGGLHIEIGTN